MPPFQRIARLFALSAVAGGLYGATFTVTSLADDGPGTLRAQLAASNATPAATIDFAVSGTIHLASSLALTFGRRNGTIIDGGGNIVISGGGLVRVVDVPSNLVITIENLTIADGSADLGGGVRNNGFLTLKNVTFQNNAATTGGAIASLDDQVDIDSCTFTGNNANAASGGGGAIAALVAANINIVNSTFTNNHAFKGGALWNDAESVGLSNTTVAGNSATTGGGIFLGTYTFSPADVTFKNTIVANNAGGNCATTVTSNPGWKDLGGNISYPDNTCPGIVADPKLGPLASNGGTTQTMALQPGSAAIDAAPNCQDRFGQVLTKDQRGQQRPQGNACDIGAYEKSPIAFTGFFGPIANPPQINVEKSGRAIPIQFSVGEFLGMNIFAAGFPASRPISCDTGLPTGPLTPIDTPGASGLSYDAFSKTYSINWKTEKGWDNTCRQLVVRLTDGVGHVATFRFR